MSQSIHCVSIPTRDCCPANATEATAGCGASIEDIQEYGRLCLLEESEENLRARYAIILKQRDAAYQRLEEAKATVTYMDDKVAHYEAILSGIAPDDTNPQNWMSENRPKHGSGNVQIVVL